jgi:hypothetical protein
VYIIPRFQDDSTIISLTASFTSLVPPKQMTKAGVTSP